MPPSFLPNINIIGHRARCERSWSLRIDSRVHFVESHTTQDIHRLQELRFSFARKPYDDIGRQRNVGSEGLADLIDLL